MQVSLLYNGNDKRRIIMIRTITIAAIFALSACNKTISDPAAQYTDAIEAFGQADYIEAIKLLEPIADEDHMEAQFLLADIYITGKLGAIDNDAGVNWLTRAAKNGHVRAASMMGVRYFNGDGVEIDHEKAATYLKAAAVAKNTKAQLLMGFLHFHGKGVEQDDNIAARYYYAAALNDEADAVDRLLKLSERGSAEALTYAGLLYKDGIGVGTNAPKAAQLVLGGAQKNFGLAQYMISHAYGSGQGFEQDYLQAHMWANLAAANGHEGADKRRDVWSQLMTPEQIAQAQDMARDWTEKFEAEQE